MKQERCSFKQQRCTFMVRFLPPLLRVDSFATYAYSCRICLLDFFIVFKPKNSKKNSSGLMRQLYAYVANESTLRSGE